MRWLVRARWLAAGAAAMLWLCAPARAAPLTGSPQIIDGDTLEVAGRRVRLFGIDAPDLDQRCRHGGRDYQCGKVARATLWDLIAGLDVSCAPAAAAPAKDGATAATCSAGDVDLNASMVRAGWALAERGATDRYVATEADAKAARRGLWQGEFEPPWAWRQAHPAGASADGDGAGAR